MQRELLADPNVIVLDNETAEGKSVSEIRFQQITQWELGGQIGTTAFNKAGIALRVKPTIAADGFEQRTVALPGFVRLDQHRAALVSLRRRPGDRFA